MPDAAATIDDVMPIGPSGPAGSATSAASQAPSALAAAPAGSVRRDRWHAALWTFGLASVALAAVYPGTIFDLWYEWGATGTFAHGYFIFPISAWLVWRVRSRLVCVAPRIQPLALLPLLACGLLWLAGHSARVHATEQYALVAMVPCLVWAVFGDEVTRRILYPLAFLFFAVPAGDFLMPALMDHTADFTVAALRLSGVPVFREGNYFSIPSGNWSVVEACSGLRYLIASITLGFLFAYLNYQATWRRLAFIVAALLVPIVANWLRAYMIVMLAHLSSNVLATGVDHLIYGWLFFGLVMTLLFWVGNLWRDDSEVDPTAMNDGGVPLERRPGSAPRAIVAMAVAAFAAVAPWPTLGNVVENIANASHPGPFALDPVDGWQAAPPFTTFVPHYLRARSISNQTFSSGGRKVGLFVAYYSGQLANGLLVTFDNDVVLVSDKIWGSVAQRSRNVSTGSGEIAVVENVVKSANGLTDQRLLTWRWYWINGRLTTNKYLAKAYNAFDKLTGRGDDSVVIVLTTPLGANESNETAEAALQAFAAAAAPEIAARLAVLHDQARR